MLGRWTDFLQRVFAAPEPKMEPEQNKKQPPNFKSKGRAFVFIGSLPSPTYQPVIMPTFIIGDATTQSRLSMGGTCYVQQAGHSLSVSARMAPQPSRSRSTAGPSAGREKNADNERGQEK